MAQGPIYGPEWHSEYSLMCIFWVQGAPTYSWGWDPSGPWMVVNLDLGWAPTWTVDGAQPGPWMGLNLDLGWGSTTWTLDGAKPGPWMGINLDQGRGPTRTLERAHPGPWMRPNPDEGRGSTWTRDGMRQHDQAMSNSHPTPRNKNMAVMAVRVRICL